MMASRPLPNMVARTTVMAGAVFFLAAALALGTNPMAGSLLFGGSFLVFGAAWQISVDKGSGRGTIFMLIGAITILVWAALMLVIFR